MEGYDKHRTGATVSQVAARRAIGKGYDDKEVPYGKTNHECPSTPLSAHKGFDDCLIHSVTRAGCDDNSHRRRWFGASESQSAMTSPNRYANADEAGHYRLRQEEAGQPSLTDDN